MDWTTVFAETGEEELVLPAVTSKAPRLSRLVSVVYHHHHHHGNHKQHSLRSAAEDEDFESHRLFVLAAEEEEDEGSDTSSSYGSPSYTLGALYCLSINYILGVGCLGIPYAFARAGFVLCGVIILTVTVMSYMTVMWVAECGARAEMDAAEERTQRLNVELVLERPPSNGKEKGSDGPGARVASKVEEPHGIGATILTPHQSESTALLQRPTTETSVRTEPFDTGQYEVIDLVSLYLGPVHKSLYQISLMALMYIGLLAYAQVFCGSVSALFPASKDAWYMRVLPQVLFGIVVVPLSCTELDEQVAVQAVMACVRFVAIFIMVGGSALALFLDDQRREDDGWDHPPYFAPPDEENCEMSYTACFSGFGVAFSTSLFSQLFQHSVPGLLRPLTGQPDRIAKVPRVFGASLLTTWTFYMILGMTAASYFGAETRSSVNLNFANFSFGLDPETTKGWVLTLCKLASSVVVMFPALDTLSVFPLIANTLGNNLLSTSSPGCLKFAFALIQRNEGLVVSLPKRLWPFRKHDTEPSYRPPSSVEEKKLLWQRASKVSTTFWRLVAAFPPLLGSIWATDLSFSLLLAGVAGLYVAFFAPSLMQLSSCRAIDISGQKRGTVFDGWYSKAQLAYPVLGFATFSLGVVLVQIRDAWLVMTV